MDFVHVFIEGHIKKEAFIYIESYFLLLGSFPGIL